MTDREMAQAEIRAFWDRHPSRGGNPIRAIRHLYPRAYVLARPAPQCLVIVRPWVDAEPHMRDWQKQHGAEVISDFDRALQAGDWCSVGYVATPSSGYIVAVPVRPRTQAVAKDGRSRLRGSKPKARRAGNNKTTTRPHGAGR